MIDANKEQQSFVLGEVQVSPSHNQIAARGQIVQLQPKVMAVLCYLARHCDQVIGNEELIEKVWPGRIVTHGSVQKSINSLRRAFTELGAEQEVITHYSKRGYQLNIRPIYSDLDVDVDATPGSESPEQKSSVGIAQIIRRPWFIAVVCSFAVACLWLLYHHMIASPLVIHKHHRTEFHEIVGYTNETGHERTAEPHPDNRHVAYIRERYNAHNLGEVQSQLMIRNEEGQDWLVATSQGSWLNLAWSPAGSQLVAVEVKREEGLPLSPDFFEKPNYLYSFHFFTLDLAAHRLLEKQQLSQWQGAIYSVTWWDEGTVEFVAKQGPNSSAKRYRYSTRDQQLSELDEPEGIGTLLASAVHNKITALLGIDKNGVQVEFLDDRQNLIRRWPLDFTATDISWIPDGSGVLVYAQQQRKLLNLYIDGEQLEIPLKDSKDSVILKPRYRLDGDAIFYTEEHNSSNIWNISPAGEKTTLTENSDFNYAASFAPGGTKVVYASVRNNQIQLWLVENGRERQLTKQAIADKVNNIVWSEDGQQLVYSAGKFLYHYGFGGGDSELLLSDKNAIDPVAYIPEKNTIFLLKNSGEVSNLWRLDTNTNKQKQLTFGSVGSAKGDGSDVYFQYAGKAGLWVLRDGGDKIERVSSSLDENSKLLAIDAGGVYFIDGGPCRESDIFYLHLDSGVKSTFIKRKNNFVNTSSFNPDRGVLETECYLPESNIIEME